MHIRISCARMNEENWLREDGREAMMILASDYDGTFFVGEEQTRKNVEAIRRWRAAGNQFGLVTGRSMEMLTWPMEKFDIPVDFLICINGSAIFRADGTLISDTPMAEERLEELENLSSIRESDLFFVLSAKGPYVRRKPGFVWAPGEMEMPPDLEPGTIRSLTPVWQFSVACGGEEAAAACARQVNEAFPDLYQAYDNIDCVDIVAAGMNKTVGIRRYMELCQTKPDDVLVIGDGGNDVDMLRTFSGFTVETGCEAAKAAASRIFASVEELVESALQGRHRVV